MSRSGSSRRVVNLHGGEKCAAIELERLEKEGVLHRLVEAMPWRRKGGHGVRPMVAFATAFLFAPPTWGVRPYLSQLPAPTARALAALAGADRLPTSGSVSRALSSLEFPQVYRFVDALLAVNEPGKALLNNPNVLHRDSHGQGWHVVDLDPTTTAFRARRLDSDEDFPDEEDVRLAPGVPGYVGQKRGELRVRHVPLAHAGSGMWLGYRVADPQTPIEEVAAELSRQARAQLSRTSSPHRVVVRADGEFGSVGALKSFEGAGVRVVTRLSRYRLLETPEGKSALQAAGWHLVPSSRSGPDREAAELGVFHLHASPGSAAAGTSVQIRVVVTRAPCAKKPLAGVWRDGWQYEMFATSLDPEAWPCEDVAALYFGRASVENRFAQEDREFGLERTFCYQTPGQAWMVAVGLFLWNRLILDGVAVAGIPAAAPPAASRPEPPARPLPARPVGEAANTSLPPAAASPPKSRHGSKEERELWGMITDAFRDLNPDKWTFDHANRVLRCQNRKPLSLTFVSAGRATISLSTRKHVCTACPFVDTCVIRKGVGTPAPTKVLRRAVTPARARRADELLAAIGRKPLRGSPDDRTDPVRLTNAPPPPRVTGPCSSTAPLFLPAASRRMATRRREQHSLAVELVERHLPPRRSTHPLVARDAADRQHRRRPYHHWVRPAYVTATLRLLDDVRDQG